MVNRIAINHNKDMRAIPGLPSGGRTQALLKERKDLQQEEGNKDNREAGMAAVTFTFSFLFGDKTTSMVTSRNTVLDDGPVSLSPLPLDDGGDGDDDAFNQEFEAFTVDEDTVGDLESPTVDEDPVGDLESPTVDEPVISTGWNTVSEADGGASPSELKGSCRGKPFMWLVYLHVAASTVLVAIKVFGHLYVGRGRTGF